MSKNHVLVSEKKYEGKYVALESFSNYRVVASGDDPAQVTKLAEEMGASQPVVLFIPAGNMTQIL
jgi:hypothetical protein